MKNTRVCTTSPYSGTVRLINLGRIRRTGRIMGINGRTAAPKHGAKTIIENILALPGVTRNRHFRTTEMLSPEYPKMKLTSTRHIRPRIGNVEGIVTTYSNIL
jgi:hypothetical protein